ncbi:hypothetical protein BDC45DRAFT_451267, partial [Circinella umbellata]
DPWCVEDINITDRFNKYQAVVRQLTAKRRTLPVEWYIHELADQTTNTAQLLLKDSHSKNWRLLQVIFN